MNCSKHIVTLGKSFTKKTNNLRYKRYVRAKDQQYYSPKVYTSYKYNLDATCTPMARATS